MKTLRPLANPRRVYCAGPLFNSAERREMAMIAGVLRRGGFETFVPHADGFEFANVVPCLVHQGYDAASAGGMIHAAIFALDTYQVVVGCGSLVFNMNGRAPDEGGVAEMTMAWMLGKPIVIYKEDVRSTIAGRDNPLVVGQAGFETVAEMELLPSVLSDRIGRLANAVWGEVPCPPQLDAVVTAGETFWRRLQALDDERPVQMLADWVIELFGETKQALPA